MRCIGFAKKKKDGNRQGLGGEENCQAPRRMRHVPQALCHKTPLGTYISKPRFLHYKQDTKQLRQAFDEHDVSDDACSQPQVGGGGGGAGPYSCCTIKPGGSGMRRTTMGSPCRAALLATATLFGPCTNFAVNKKICLGTEGPPGGIA